MKRHSTRPLDTLKTLVALALGCASIVAADTPVFTPNCRAGFSAPVLISRVEPKAASGAKGMAIVELLIGSTGRIEGVRLLRGFHAEADRAALEASLHWRFTPATCNGRPVGMHFTATFQFPIARKRKPPRSAPPATR